MTGGRPRERGLGAPRLNRELDRMFYSTGTDIYTSPRPLPQWEPGEMSKGECVKKANEWKKEGGAEYSYKKIDQMWFSGYPEDQAAAKQICFGCEVREKCLRIALASAEGSGHNSGIWGGFTPEERKVLKGRLRTAAMKGADVEGMKWAEVGDELTGRGIRGRRR